MSATEAESEVPSTSCPRLVDYILIVSNRHLKSSSSVYNPPELIKCYPPQQHKDFPLPPDVVYFCQPNGCLFLDYPRIHRMGMNAPNSFVFQLTDKDTNKSRFGVCLNFYTQLFPMADSSEDKNKIKSCCLHASSSTSNRRNSAASRQGEVVSKQTAADHNAPPPIRYSRTHALTTLCILTHHPYVTPFQTCLLVLKNILDEIHLRLPVDRLNLWGLLGSEVKPSANVQDVLRLFQAVEIWMLKFLSIPVPVPGKCRIEVILAPTDKSCVVEFSTPSYDRLQLLDFPLHLPLDILDVEKYLQVLTCVLLEKRIIIQSRDPYLCTTCVAAFIAILYPLQYMFTVIPLLPTSMPSAEQIFMAPSPYIIGVTDTFFKCKRFELPPDAWIVNLDKKKVQPVHPNETVPTLPSDAGSTLRNHLRKVADLLNAQKPIADLESLLRAVEEQDTKTDGGPNALATLRSISSALPSPNSQSSSSPSTSPSLNSLIIVGNDPDSVDVSLRVAMIRFLHHPAVLANFPAFTRTLRSHPRPLVEFQKENFLRSQASICAQFCDTFLQQLVETQSVQSLATWLLLSQHDAYRHILSGMYDPLIIGDKRKWYAALLPVRSFTLFPEKEPLFSNKRLMEMEEIAPKYGPLTCNACYKQFLEEFQQAHHSQVLSDLHLKIPPTLVNAGKYYQVPTSPYLPDHEASPSTVTSPSQPFFRSLTGQGGLVASFRKSFRAPSVVVPSKVVKPVIKRRESVITDAVNPKMVLRPSVEWLRLITSPFVSSSTNQLATFTLSSGSMLNVEVRAYLQEVVDLILQGKTPSIFTRSRFAKYMQREACRNFVLFKLNGNLICGVDDVTSTGMDDIVLPKRSVYHALCWVIEVVVRGIEYSVTQGSPGGNTSVFLLLEIMHTHFIYTLFPERQSRTMTSTGSVRSALSVPNGELRETESSLTVIEAVTRALASSGLFTPTTLSTRKGSSVNLNGEEYEDIDVVSGSPTTRSEGANANNSRGHHNSRGSSVSRFIVPISPSPAVPAPRRDSYTAFLWNHFSSNNSITQPNSPMPRVNLPIYASNPSVMLTSTRHLSNSDPSIATNLDLSSHGSNSSLAGDSFFSNNNTFGASQPSPWLRANMALDTAKTTLSIGCRYSTIGEIHSVRQLDQSEARSYLFQQFVPASLSPPQPAPALFVPSQTKSNDISNPPSQASTPSLLRRRNSRVGGSTFSHSEAYMGQGQILATESAHRRDPPHALWDNMQFWEDLFFDTVAQEREIAGLDQDPRDVWQYYKDFTRQVSPPTKNHKTSTKLLSDSAISQEKHRLEVEEDRVLSTTVHNLMAFMVMMAVPLREIKLKVRRLIARCHIGLKHSQELQHLLDNLPSLRGNDIDLKPMASRNMCRLSFPVHLHIHHSGPTHFLEVTAECLILRDEEATVCYRWWFEIIVNFTLNVKSKMMTLFWCHLDGRTLCMDFHSRFCRELFHSLEENIVALKRTLPNQELNDADRSVFPVELVDLENEASHLRVDTDVVVVVQKDKEVRIPVHLIKQCFSEGLDEVVIQCQDLQTKSLKAHRFKCTESTSTATLLTRLHRLMSIHLARNRVLGNAISIS